MLDAKVNVEGLLIAIETPTGPNAVPEPTTMVISVLETILQDGVIVPDAGTVPIVAVHVCDDVMKFEPVTVIVDPENTTEGAMLLTVGLAVTVSAVLLVVAINFSTLSIAG